MIKTNMKIEKQTIAEYRETMIEIIREILDLQDEEVVKEWFSGISQLMLFGRKYSYSNLILVHNQRPHAVWTEGPKTWNKHKCYWKPGTQIGIYAPTNFARKCRSCGALNFKSGKQYPPVCKKCKVELEPNDVPMGFKVVPVFDFQDLDVKEEAEKFKKIQLIREMLAIRAKVVQKLGDEAGYRTREEMEKLAKAVIEYAEGLGFEVREMPPERMGTAGGSTDGKVLNWNSGLGMGRNSSVLVHELGHALHHFKGNQKDRQEKELEAEIFSALVMSGVRADITKNAAYLLNWSLGADPEKRETMFLRAFHAVYEQAFMATRYLVGRLEEDLESLFRRIEALQAEEAKKWKETAQSPGARKKQPEKKPEDANTVKEFCVRRPGRLGIATAPDLEGICRTILQDDKKQKVQGHTVTVTAVYGNGKKIEAELVLAGNFVMETLQEAVLDALGLTPETPQEPIAEPEVPRREGTDADIDPVKADEKEPTEGKSKVIYLPVPMPKTKKASDFLPDNHRVVREIVSIFALAYKFMEKPQPKWATMLLLPEPEPVTIHAKPEVVETLLPATSVHVEIPDKDFVATFDGFVKANAVLKNLARLVGEDNHGGLKMELQVEFDGGKIAYETVVRLKSKHAGQDGIVQDLLLRQLKVEAGRTRTDLADILEISEEVRRFAEEILDTCDFEIIEIEGNDADVGKALFDSMFGPKFVADKNEDEDADEDEAADDDQDALDHIFGMEPGVGNGAVAFFDDDGDDGDDFDSWAKMGAEPFDKDGNPKELAFSEIAL